MKSRPILFNGPMVRAILSGAKTQTRRAIKTQPLRIHGQPIFDSDFGPGPGRSAMVLLADYSDAQERLFDHEHLFCPFGVPGDRLWIRETFARKPEDRTEVVYRATVRDDIESGALAAPPAKWTASIHMPRWACRLEVEISGIRAERLSSISEFDALAEGIREAPGPIQEGTVWYCAREGMLFPTARAAFLDLWRTIYGIESVRADPFLWVVDFRRIE